MNILKEIAIHIASIILFVGFCSFFIVMVFLPFALFAVYRTPYPLLLYVLYLCFAVVVEAYERRK